MTGETILYRVTAEELGLTGIYTMSDIIPGNCPCRISVSTERDSSAIASVIPKSTRGPVDNGSLQPNDQGAQGTYVFALGGGSVQYPGKHLIAVNARAALGEEYQSFVVTK